MVEPLRHRQTKGAETDMPGLPPPRHIPTLPFADVAVNPPNRLGGFDRCREAEGNVAIRVRPQMAARHGQADASALGGCVYIRVVLFCQNITCVFDNWYTMSERCEMPTKSLPAASLRTEGRLPAGRTRLRVPNCLICMVLWSVEQWIVGAVSGLLPVLRE